ncbi:transcriptional regulator, AraC family [Oceanospirillum multiglobuliferum]|uniref:AraC family transcriptional regulator n=1 Tax=Oceanospirillum multiglobuliferum TaxID=64969 RepID=A0A1T4KJH8_9GAMM|nr:AraC family transcriptional regulator [Oceanospirillum multiglobuliferum]OPX56049.1 AraC family transcriptional regulator [Oceanospirillum multiglobuliferum]SJZ42523.1 transcriptional regulator, AraC family [Oceanospirillum multiglobuliferum]
MIAIPLPFVIALLLSILAILLFIRREEGTQSAFVFIALCALTTTIVGLRWSFDYPLFRLLQPVLASCIPVTAWYCFSSAHNRHKFYLWHLLPPILVMLSAFTYPFWRPPLDPILTLLYIGYGVALINASFKTSRMPERVRFSDIDKALKAERIAGSMLLMSACIDGALAIDFTFFTGTHALVILAIGHTVLLPVLSIAVIMVSLSIVPSVDEASKQDAKYPPVETSKEKPHNSLTDDEIKEIVNKIDTLITSKEIFLDPDLTLDRLARKACIPARQISVAINKIYGRNVSQVVNEYRIERAKTLLVNSNKTITQIYLESGFQTKSNFNREFSRVTEQTPSAFRRAHLKST